eukprot:187239_1
MKSINTFACCMHMMNVEDQRCFSYVGLVMSPNQVSSDKDYGEHSWFTQKVYKNWISILHIRIYGICQRRKAEYTQSLQEIDEEYCEDFRMEIAAMVIHMSYGHRDCNKQGKPWYKYSQFCKAKNKRYKSKTFMVNGEPHAYPSNKAFCEGVLQVLIGHYFTNSQVHAIVKAWHSNANESLHSMVYTKVDKDKKTNYDDYTSGVKSGASDWNVGHEQSVTDRFDSMGIPMNGVQASGLEKRRLVGQKHKLYQNLDEVKTKRKVKRHKKNNTDNSYSSCNHTV